MKSAVRRFGLRYSSRQSQEAGIVGRDVCRKSRDVTSGSSRQDRDKWLEGPVLSAATPPYRQALAKYGDSSSLSR